jgi:hypothetical protein
MLKDIVDENIYRKGIEKEAIANLQKKKKKKKKPGGDARGVTNIKVYNLFIPFQVPKY